MLSNRPSILSMASSSKSLLPHSPMRKASTVRFADDDDKEEENYRLRASIKRKHTDRIYQWLHVGCGSCFLHENNGGNITDILKEKSDYEREFPKQLQRQMSSTTLTAVCRGKMRTSRRTISARYAMASSSSPD